MANLDCVSEKFSHSTLTNSLSRLVNIMIKMKAHLAIAILATLTFCSQGFAQNYILGYDITGDGGTPGSFAYNVAPGAQVDVTVTLTEDVTGGGTARLAPGGNDGLFLSLIHI